MVAKRTAGKLDVWECEECDLVFTTRADPKGPPDDDETEECPRCEADAVLVAGGQKGSK